MIKVTTITQTVVIKAELSRVYEAFTNPLIHSAFTGAKATGGGKLGKFTAWDGYIYGSVVKLVKNKELVLDWMTTEWPSDYSASVVKITFTKKVDGTKIILTQTKVPLTQAGSYRQGWKDFYWKPLKEYFKRTE